MKVLYLGTDPKHFKTQAEVIHYPVISIQPRPFASVQDYFIRLPSYTHLLFTSKNSVKVFCDYLVFLPASLDNKIILAIGTTTAHALRLQGIHVNHLAKNATQEGMVQTLQQLALHNSYIFYPRSSCARPHLATWLKSAHIRHEICDLYDTYYQAPEPIPCLKEIDQVVFTSPSTVHGFFRIFPKLPSHIHCHSIGPITRQTLETYIMLQEVKC